MKVSGWLLLALLTTACGGDRVTEEREPVAPAEPPQAFEATTGDEEGGAVAAVPRAEAPARPKGPSPQADARAAAVGAVTRTAVEDGVNPDAAVLQDFHRRVNAYLEIHKDAAKGDARPKETPSPTEINAREQALAARIRAARPTAKQGDLFTAEVRHKFRRLLAPELKGEDGRDAKAVLKDDAPPTGSIPFAVNAKYPEGAPLPSVPANVLLNLPTLPNPLEYRIIGRHLVLLDTAADLIVDYIPNAIQ